MGGSKRDVVEQLKKLERDPEALAMVADLVELLVRRTTVKTAGSRRGTKSS